MIELYKHQGKSVGRVYDEWDNFVKNVLLVEPTGAGKTYIKGQFARDAVLRGDTVIIFAHRDVLLSQISLSLGKMGVPHTFIAVRKTITDITNIHVTDLGKSFYDDSSKIIVASVDTYTRRLAKGSLVHLLPIVKMWMLDEAHHCLKDNKWGKCVASLPNAIGLGVTATPIRSDRRGLGSHSDGVFDSMIVGSTMGELIETGFLSMYKIFVPPTLLDIAGLNITSSGDYNQRELAKRTDRADITGDTVDQYLKLANGKQTITFCVNIAHSEHVAAEFNKAGIPSVALSSKTDINVRQKQIAEFRAGRIRNLCNCDLFGEGFDVPSVACVIMLRKTDSYSLFKQQFGRLLRIIEGKDFGILIDQVGNVPKHCIYGAPHDDPEWTLDAITKRSRDLEIAENRTCPECRNYYTPTAKNRFLCPECSHEETKSQTISVMRKFIVDNSDLVEMTVDFIKNLKKERSRVDLNPARKRSNMVHAGMPTKTIDAAVNSHTRRQFAQARLRKKIQAFGLKTMRENEWDLKTFQMHFEKTFGVNILKAQVLSERLSLELLEKIENV